MIRVVAVDGMVSGYLDVHLIIRYVVRVLWNA